MMSERKRQTLVALSVFVLLTVMCNIGPLSITLDNPFDSSRGGFGSITFAEDVTDEGDLVKPAQAFAGGIKTVWAYFTFQGLSDGKSWGRYWEKDGKEYIDARGEK
jgi:hypothetical protein